MLLSHNFIGHFFAYAPWVLGLVIFAVTYVAKRKETVAGVPIGQTFACANCGRRAVREHMLAQAHGGAVSWYCANCAGTH